MNPSAYESLLIVGGGSCPSLGRLRQVASEYQAIIAADFGVAFLRQAGLSPLYLTGDFDSVTADDLGWVTPEQRRHDPDQSTTDLEKAILLAIGLGARRFGIACATGDRMDHSVNAISLMVRYSDRAEFTLHDAHGDATLAFAPGITITGTPGEKLSLVPAPGATGVRSTGLMYPLDGIDLLLGSRDGISNELTKNEARLTFLAGSLLVYRLTAQLD
jgi:thiamine pyrophosphokinase